MSKQALRSPHKEHFFLPQFTICCPNNSENASFRPGCQKKKKNNKANAGTPWLMKKNHFFGQGEAKLTEEYTTRNANRF